MNLYAETSAVLAWLLGEPDASRVRKAQAGATTVVSSDLTLVECDRVLIRAVTLGEIAEAAAADRRARLNAVATGWHVLRVNAEVVARARHGFPAGPIRTLDALHLASALVARGAVPGLAVLTLDQRIHASAAALGLPVVP